MSLTTLTLALWTTASTAQAQTFSITDHGIVVPVGAPGSYHEYNVGSPSVTYDPDAGQFVMFFEYRGAWGTPSRCASGAGTEWGIGRATSPDGVSWTVDKSPALHPSAGTFWECAAVHPHVVYEGKGQWHLFFKAWQEDGKTCDDDNGNPDGITDPAWGCDIVTGVGHATSTDGITWSVPSSLPVLAPSVVDPSPEDFGWPRVVQVSGTWMLFMNYGDNGITLATAEDPAGPWAWEGYNAGTGGRSEVLEPSSTYSWMEDELLVADVTCHDEPGSSMLDLWFGGHDRDPADFWGPPLSRALGFADAVDVDSFIPYDPPEILWSASDVATDVAWRSWSTVELGSGDYLIYYQRKLPSGNEVGLAYTTKDTSWDLGTVQPDVCTWFGNAPSTFDDAHTVEEDGALTVTAPGVMANDVDHERNAFSVSLATNPAHGTVTLDDDGAFHYVPDADFFGEDTFTYVASDTANTSIEADVVVTVTGTPDAPNGSDDTYALSEDGALVVDAGSGVLSNDVDVDGDTLTAVLVEGVTFGTLKLSPDGSFTYTPEPDAFGTDSFTYEAHDADSSSATQTVTLTVSAVNDPPTAADHAYTLAEDTPLVVKGALIGPDADIEGDSLSVRVVDDVSHGTLDVQSDGTFRYTPAADYHGPDGFTYVVHDGTDDSEVATVTLTVTAVNDAPVAQPDAYETLQDTVLNVPAGEGVLANDSDAEDDTLTATLVTEPRHGTLTLGDGGNLTYTPEDGFVGVDMFTYVVSDGARSSTAASVTLEVTAERGGCSTSPLPVGLTPLLLLVGLSSRRRR